MAKKPYFLLKDAPKKPCRHRQSWLIGSGIYEWCYECGAFRALKKIGLDNALSVDSPWCRPTGYGGENPHAAWAKARITYRKRMETKRGKRV